MTLQRRASIFAAAAMILAGLAGLGAYVWLEQVETDLREEMRGTNRAQSVVVANEDIPAGTAISAESVRLVSFPTEAIPEGVFDDASRVSGRIVVAPLRRNEPVLEPKLAPVEVTHGGIAALTGRDKRAMAVRVDEVVAVAGFIQPGDRVDVLATLHTDEEASRPITKIIVENVPVLATGERATDASKVAPGGNEDGPRVMTLEVSPPEAERLALASSEGRIHLVLRHPLNGAKAGTDGATVEGLLGRRRGAEAPAPAPLVAHPAQPAAISTGRHQARPSVVSVEVIRGLQRSDVRFAPTPQSEAADEPVR
jgi:pilus assembly protein CpaB